MAESEAQPEPAEREQYGSFETIDGDLIMYDRDHPTAWLQSDTLVQVEQ